MDPALHELLAEGAADDEVAVIVRLDLNLVPPEGLRIVARFGPVATVRLRRGDILSLRAHAAVRSMKAAHLYGPMPSDEDHEEATEFAGAPSEDLEPLPGDVRRPHGLASTGRGVVLAHIDWGVDVAHPDFRHADGRTRLLALWDQGQGMDPAAPNRYGYGRIYTPAQVDAALAAPDPYAALGYRAADSDPGGGSHGTHTLGISAGNGRAGGPAGVAPDAELVFVHLSTTTADGPTRLGDSVALLEAFDFIASIAGERPVVVNASIGRHAGEHDGRTLVEQGMDAWLELHPGRAIVLSTGNYFRRASHACGLLRPGERALLRVVADAERRTPTEVDLWYPGIDVFTVHVRGPEGVRQVRCAPGEHAALLQDGREVGRLYHRLHDPNNGDNQVTLMLYAAAPPARWEIELTGDDVADGRYHAWVERDPICARCQAHFIDADSEPTGTTGTICNGLRTIAVGAYNAHRQERPLARFSSCGPTRDGRQKPDLVAPGVRVLAARSAPREARADAPLLTRMSGTSMAAPHVTGTIALMFEAAGRLLHIDETRRLLLGQAEELDPASAPLVRLRTGSGFLDIAAAVRAAASPTPPGRIPTMSENEAGPAGPMESDEEAQRRREGALPFQVQLPIGGGAPALALPLGGAASPFAVTLPLGGSAPPPPAAAPTPAPAPQAAAPAPAPAPAEPDPFAALTNAPPLYEPPLDAMWADSAPPGARPLLRRGARGPAVEEAQAKLNTVHQRQQAQGAAGLAGAPLTVDGVFGQQTYNATVSFQRLAFPGQPNEWDGVIGPKTWSMLDAMSAAQVPAPPLPTVAPDVPPIIPVNAEGCGNLSIWINAFIPRDVTGYTFTVPAGPHAGKTAIPCPAVATPVNPTCPWRGYLTDQRGFDNDPSASVRMRSRIDIALTPPAQAGAAHVTSGTTEIDKSDGRVTCRQPADMTRCSFTNFRVTPQMFPPGSFEITVDYRGAASDPCVNLAADIDYNGQIRVLCVPASNLVLVTVAGFVDSFPAFEMYAKLGSSTQTLFRLAPPAGNTVADLLGGASTPVAGRAQFECSFLQQQAVPGSAFAASADERESLPALAAAHECECGTRRVARAEALAAMGYRGAGMVDALLAEGDDVAVAEPPPGAPRLSPVALFNAFAYPDYRAAQLQRFGDRFDVLARPGEPLAADPQPGDLLVRSARGENWGNLSVVAAPGVQDLSVLPSAGLRAEAGGRLPGGYLHVVDLGPMAQGAAAGFARRVADAAGRVPADTVLLRPRTGAAPAAEAAADCGCGGAVAVLDQAETEPATLDPTCSMLAAFARDSDVLLPLHRIQIEAAALYLINHHIGGVTVTGFASSDGERSYNQALGMRRAQRVAAELHNAMEHLRAGSSAGVTVRVNSRGEDEQIAGGLSLNRRVTICPDAAPAPVPVQQRFFRITAKSFIAHIGSHIGSLSCGIDTAFGNIPSPLTNPALRAFAAATDVAFSETATSDGIFIAPPPDNKGYRLFSSVRLQVEHRGTELVSASVVGGLLTDAGKECVPATGACLSAPPLITDAAPSILRLGPSSARVSWQVRGRPPTAAEAAFNTICMRTSVYIWHRVTGVVDCSSGVPVWTSLRVEGSRFPSHRLWIDGTVADNRPQGPFSALWDSTPGDPTRVL
ncbi:MAG: S8 family serine peptidase [Telluria sp.]